MQLDLGRATAQPVAQGERRRLTTGGHTAHLPEGALAIAPQVNAADLAAAATAAFSFLLGGWLRRLPGIGPLWKKELPWGVAVPVR